MSKQMWAVSDTHFGHENILGFKDNFGIPLRGRFASVEEMDNYMVQQWNSVVKPHDRVYHLGDVAMQKRHISIVNRCNGKKILLLGNHDIFGAKEYLKYFDDVRAYKIFPKHGIILSHIPLYEGQLEHRWKLNIHGHLHANNILKDGARDVRYLNVSVEQTNYAPINLNKILDVYLKSS